jgi:hypothetical protein
VGTVNIRCAADRSRLVRSRKPEGDVTNHNHHHYPPHGPRLRFCLRGVAVGASLNGCYDMDWNITAIKEGESELPVMIAIIERNREDRERNVVIDR